jgi:hypothetical protein
VPAANEDLLRVLYSLSGTTGPSAVPEKEEEPEDLEVDGQAERPPIDWLDPEQGGELVSLPNAPLERSQEVVILERILLADAKRLRLECVGFGVIVLLELLRLFLR